ncbi:MAG: hypothetical protein IAE63_05055 [Alphaproteobacteria bacterium]|nr:hypothetical protein [Alphaproteobacteria bacterium]
MTQKAYAEAKEWEYGVDGAVAPSAISGLLALYHALAIGGQQIAVRRKDNNPSSNPS